MDRRTMLAGLPLIGAAMATAVIAGELPAPLPEVEELVAAIVSETDVFRTTAADDEDAGSAAVSRSYAAGMAVMALPASKRAHPDFLPAVALFQRRWLVMEGDYADPHEQASCLLVDGVLAGTRFDDLPMLWHIDGKQFDRRPTEAQFAKARSRAEGAR